MAFRKRPSKSQHKDSDINKKARVAPAQERQFMFRFNCILVVSMIGCTLAGLLYFTGNDETGKDLSREQTASSQYAKENITNSADYEIRQVLDEAVEHLSQRNSKEADRIYNDILTQHPNSPRAIAGLANVYCMQSEKKQSIPLLELCIKKYLQLLDTPDVPKALMLQSSRICIHKQLHRGWVDEAVQLSYKFIEMYPDETKLTNDLGFLFLKLHKPNDAKPLFAKTLLLDPENIYAKAYLGFIYQTTDNDPDKSIPLLREALSSSDISIHDGILFYHLGDALQRVGNITEAFVWYEKGVDLGYLPSTWQRSLYNVKNLTARPWWTKEETGQQKLIQVLEENWKTIRDEGLANMDDSGSFLPEKEHLRETGDWKHFTLFARGQKNQQNCEKAPKTCALMEEFPDATMCKRGQVKYSVMQPGVHVWPHCGPTNCRVRMHLGLSIPKDCCRIRVLEDIRTWEEGKVIIFDDSFEHEVWHDGEAFRLVLIVDIWHPELTARHKQSLSPI